MNPLLILNPVHYGPGTDSVRNNPLHPECYTGDTALLLSDCPFPLQTDSFRVLHYGKESGRKAGGLGTFVIVEQVRQCGHLSHQRIRFEEGVEDFVAHGVPFSGASYSEKNWQARIERFRNTACEVCALANHFVWIWEQGLAEMSRAAHRKLFLHTMDWNYTNWREIVPEADVLARLDKAKRGKR